MDIIIPYTLRRAHGSLSAFSWYLTRLPAHLPTLPGLSVPAQELLEKYDITFASELIHRSLVAGIIRPDGVHPWLLQSMACAAGHELRDRLSMLIESEPCQNPITRDQL